MWIKTIHFLKHSERACRGTHPSSIVINQHRLENHRKQEGKKRTGGELWRTEARMLPAWPAQVGGCLRAEGCEWEILDEREGAFLPSPELADTGAHQTQVTWVASAAMGEAGEHRQDHLQGVYLKRAASPSGANSKSSLTVSSLTAMLFPLSHSPIPHLALPQL